MPLREPEEPKQSVSLHIGSSFASAWESVLLPWFKEVKLASLKNNETVAVATPFPSGAAFLRSKLLEHEIPLLGVKFITPPRLRELLLAEDASSLSLREHLRLLMAIAAESVARLTFRAVRCPPPPNLSPAGPRQMSTRPPQPLRRRRLLPRLRNRSRAHRTICCGRSIR